MMKRFLLVLLIGLLGAISTAEARDIKYSGGEQTIYVKPNEPTQISFPSDIEGGFKATPSAITLDKQDNYLIVFASGDLADDGEGIIVHLSDKRTYSLRVLPEAEGRPRDGFVRILDTRAPDSELEAPTVDRPQTGFAPPTIVSGLMREMILVAEFGKKKGIPGYRRSNRYSGEVVLHDGTVKATIEEIFMGPDLWGYVLDVENLLETTQAN